MVSEIRFLKSFSPLIRTVPESNWTRPEHFRFLLILFRRHLYIHVINSIKFHSVYNTIQKSVSSLGTCTFVLTVQNYIHYRASTYCSTSVWVKDLKQYFHLYWSTFYASTWTFTWELNLCTCAIFSTAMIHWLPAAYLNEPAPNMCPMVL